VILYPRLTDISTDLIDIPEFSAFQPSERAAGEDRSLQGEAYPQVAARFYPVTIDRAFMAMRSLVDDRGWAVDHVEAPTPPEPPAASGAAEPSTGARGAGTVSDLAVAPESLPAAGEASIEATARTLLFAFPDHIVIRMTETGQGTRVDVRSASELGAHDLGTNARRIVRFLSHLDAVLQGMEDAGPAEEALPSGPAPAMPSPRPATR
jgi:hypothetical protein